MKPSITCRIAVIAGVGLALSCARQTDLPAADATKSESSQKLPFDRQPQSAGISPSRSLIPSVTRLPEGTPLTICLQRNLSSASAHTGDSFAATLDAPIVIDGQTLAPRGAAVSGSVLDAKPSAGPHDPGYLRLALVTLTVSERTFPIETSSLFAKGGAREERSSAMIGASAPAGPTAAVQTEIVLGPERRLSFRLARDLDLR
ncbi:MAG: hypothetical protein LAO56_15255 [Acidobacteriia bacterium]|jgi:hypothetical protein|nr:hypothetical protein [Terriglobia bacterium]